MINCDICLEPAEDLNPCPCGAMACYDCYVMMYGGDIDDLPGVNDA